VTETFKYDPFGRRIYKSSSAGTSVYAYDGDNLIEETNSSGAVAARYEDTQNIDEPLAMLRSGATGYYHADGLGSIILLSNAAGSLAQTYTFDSFGNQTASSGSLTNPFRYTAREFDTETSLYYYRARYYDTLAGRFVSEDPVRFDSGPGFYTYVRNSPILFIDPTGLQEITLLPKEQAPVVNSAVGSGVAGGMTPRLVKAPDEAEQIKCGSKDCVRVHEESHIADLLAANPKVCKGAKYGRIPAWNDPRDYHASEVKANIAEIDCLWGKMKNACNECKMFLFNKISEAEGDRAFHQKYLQ
jgi:RHS repeat-associated protein